jgi:hypothetical protein
MWKIFYIISSYSGRQKRFHISDFHNKDTVIPKEYCRILTPIWKELISSCWRKDSKDFTVQKVNFPYSPSRSPDAKVRTLSSETQSPMKVRMAQRTRATESIHLQEVWTAQQTRATESTRLQGGPDANAMTANSRCTLCNCPDARVASPDMLQWFHEVLVTGPDAAYANPSLSRIKISEAYL